jgi:hypothetical protein
VNNGERSPLGASIGGRPERFVRAAGLEEECPVLPRHRQRFAATALLVCGLAVAGIGCTQRQGVRDQNPLGLSSPTALDRVGDTPEDVQRVPIQVVDGRFVNDVYATQTGPARLRVTTLGGPYTMSIDQLLQPRELPANATTEIPLTLPDPGEYTIQLAGAARDTAVLNVRPLGQR